jgi:COMPASS component BRE2
MSESHSPRGVTPASSIPQKRSLEDEHAPAVSSPLNPDIASSTKVAKFAKDKEAIQRERREKKETLKKREAKGGGNAARGTPDPSGKDEPRQSRGTVSSSSRMTPLRYKLAPPPAAAYRRPVPPVFALHHTKPKLGLDGEETDFYEISDTLVTRNCLT